MRTYGRLLAFGAICAGALGLAATPAFALSVSVGGTTSIVGPISLPLPTTSVSLGPDAPLALGVQAPASTAVSVTAGPTGLSAKATAADAPLVDVSVGPPDVSNLTAPASATTPGAGSTPGASPIVGATPTSSPTPAESSPGAGSAPKGRASVAPGARLGPAAVPLTERQISATHRITGDPPASLDASIASSPRSDLLSSLPAIGARLMLWILLAGVVVALRLFLGSPPSRATSRAPRAS